MERAIETLLRQNLLAVARIRYAFLQSVGWRRNHARPAHGSGMKRSRSGLTTGGIREGFYKPEPSWVCLGGCRGDLVRDASLQRIVQLGVELRRSFAISCFALSEEFDPGLDVRGPRRSLLQLASVCRQLRELVLDQLLMKQCLVPT